MSRSLHGMPLLPVGFDTAYGKEMRRIPYPASVWNEALKPLSTLGESGAKFDKILYINDVVFSVSFPYQS